MQTSFYVDLRRIAAWERESVCKAVMQQGHKQGMDVDAEMRGAEMSVTIQSDEPMHLTAYEAAIRCWVTEH